MYSTHFEFSHLGYHLRSFNQGLSQNLILEASSYSQKILKNLFLGYQNRPGYGPVCNLILLSGQQFVKQSIMIEINNSPYRSLCVNSKISVMVNVLLEKISNYPLAKILTNTKFGPA